jgi:hypothetical protein
MQSALQKLRNALFAETGSNVSAAEKEGQRHIALWYATIYSDKRSVPTIC